MVQQSVSDKPLELKKPAATAPPRRRVWPTNPAVALWSTAVGKKVVMAVTGVFWSASSSPTWSAT